MVVRHHFGGASRPGCRTVRGRWPVREYTQTRREPGQVVVLVVSGLFVVAAVLDAGPGSLDNLVHLCFGLLGFALSRDPAKARGFLIGGGVAYLLFWQFGTVVDPSLVPFHTTNAGIHLALVASMIGLAVLGRTESGDAPEYAPEYTYVGDIARPRPTRNRPPGRDDRRSTRLTPERRPGALAYRN
jgi:uncharacterized protein DUF4383